MASGAGPDDRVDTSGRDGEITSRQARRRLGSKRLADVDRVDAFRPVKRAPLNDAGRMNRGKPAPRLRVAEGSDAPGVAEALSHPGSLWRTTHVQWLKFGSTGTEVASLCGHGELEVPEGSVLTFLGRRRVEAVHEFEGKDVRVRGTELHFTVMGRRCTVWDFSAIEPIDDSDDDAEDDPEDDPEGGDDVP